MNLKTLRLDCIIDGKRLTYINVVNVESETTFRDQALRRDVTTFASPELIATVLLWHDACKCAQFSKLFVRHDMRRKGIASVLLATCEEIALASMCKTITCTVTGSNEDAQDCYKKAGYNFAFEYEDGDLIMCKQL